MDYITILEYIGVFAFAVSGAIVAIEEEFDVFGVYIIAIITAMGGGVLRDIVSDVGIPVFFTSYMTIPFIIAGTLLAIFLKGNLKYKNLFVFIDAIGLAAFFVSAHLYFLHFYFLYHLQIQIYQFAIKDALRLSVSLSDAPTYRNIAAFHCLPYPCLLLFFYGLLSDFLRFPDTTAQRILKSQAYQTVHQYQAMIFF